MDKNVAKRFWKNFKVKTEVERIIKQPEEDFERDEYTEDYQLEPGRTQTFIYPSHVYIGKGVAHIETYRGIPQKQKIVNERYEVIDPKITKHLKDIAKGSEL